MPHQHTRRKFLKAAGVSLALPMLESFASAHKPTESETPEAKRLVSIGTYLGYHTPSFFPGQSGREYKTTPLLKPLEELRDDFTVFSGLDHRAPNGHKYWSNFLTGTGIDSVSMDQLVAAKLGQATRFSSLELTCGKPPAEGRMNFTKEGVLLPMIGRPSVLFEKLFASESRKTRMRYTLDSGRSVLDFVLEEARSLEKQVTAADRVKLSEYFASVREVEQRLQKQRKWLDKPSAEVDYTLPQFDPVAPDLSLECETIMYDLMVLALETDSTRVLSFLVPGSGQVFTINGKKLDGGYHGLSHHGNQPARIREFLKINLAHIGRFARFLKALKTKKDSAGRPLLKSTIVLFGSGMGDANIHENANLPTIVAGGGFKHGRHIAIDRSKPHAPLLGDLYITLMQRVGMEIDRFASAKQNLNGMFS